MIFPDLLANETIHWQAPFMNGTGKSVTVTPKVAGSFAVTCKINNRKGISQNITVVQAVINGIMFTDSRHTKTSYS